MKSAFAHPAGFLRVALCAVIGAAFPIWGSSKINAYSFDRVSLGAKCFIAGKVGFSNPDGSHWCIDLADAYPQQDAMDRIVDKITKNMSSPQADKK